MGKGVLCGVLLVIILLACQEIPLEEGPGVNRTNLTHDAILDIPRSNASLDEGYDAYVPPKPERKPWPNQTSLPGIELDVLLGDTIGEDHPLITRAEFPLLGHPVIRVHTNRVLGYEETLRFGFGSNSTGKVIFTKDEDDEIGTFLLFEEGKTILEYRLALASGTFEDIQGRDIQILGHTYVIAEASNMTVALYGRSVASNLLFEDGERLVVNSSSQIGTVSAVRPGAVSFRLMAEGPDGDILLSQDETLAGTIGWRALASDLFDIRYAGAPLSSAERIAFERTRFGYRLVTDRGTMPLVEKDGDALVLGKAGERLRITPCPAGKYCVAPGDRLLLTAPNGTSHIYEYRSVDDSAENLIMRDEDGNRYLYEYTGTPGKDARTAIIAGGFPFAARIGPRDNATGEHNISVDQGFRSGRAEIVTGPGIIIRIGDPRDMVLPVDIIIPASLTKDRKQQSIGVRLMYDDAWRAVVTGNLTFFEDDRNDDSYAVTPHGAIVHLEREDSSLPLNVGDDLVILIPDEPAYGTVVLEE